MAVVSADRHYLKAKAAEGSPGAKLVLHMLERPEFLVGTCLVGTNLSMVGSATVATAALVETLAGRSEHLVVLFVFPLTLVIGELVPKSVFQYHANRLAPVVIFPLRACSLLFFPALLFLESCSKLLLRLMGGEADQSVTREDIRGLLQDSEEVSLDPDDRDLIKRVFAFTEASVQDVMVPLIEVVMVPREASAKIAIGQIEASGHSWLPIYEDRVDNVIGILHHSDLLFLENLSQQVENLMRPLKFVPETKRVDELFLEFRRERARMAMAVDEYGGAVGLVSREDLLEEIVGDIDDEYDAPSPWVRRTGEREWQVRARVEREPLELATEFRLPEGDYETLAGFLLSRLGHVPIAGEVVREAGWMLEVSRATDRAIIEVRLVRPA
jgi:CBS domain containing-hemolysin-like protein